MNSGVSVLIPTRGRPERFKKAAKSALGTAVGEVEILSYVDEDDPLRDKYDNPTIVGPRINLPAAHYALEKLAKHYFLLMGADDVIFRTQGWDEKMKAAMPEDGIGCVFTADGWKNTPNHCLYTKRLSEITGCIYPMEFEHFGMDTYFSDCMKAVDRFIYLPDVLLEHHHFRNGRADKDDTYCHPRDNMANQRDTRRLDELRKSRMPKDIQILKAEIERYSASTRTTPAT